MATDTNKKDENVETDFLDSTDGVLDTVLASFAIPEEPIAPLPPRIIMTGGKLRSGLSKSAIISNIISRESEAGLPIGDVFADGPNSNERLIKIIVEEVMSALLNDCVVNVVIDPGIAVKTSGANAGGPMTSVGATTTMGIGNGILR